MTAAVRDESADAPVVRRGLAAAAVRWRWPLLVVWTAGWLAARHGVVGDWSFFERASRALHGPHPLSLYADYPRLQIGPLALIAALPLTGHGSVLPQAVIYALGLLSLRVVERCWPGDQARAVLVGGLLVVPCWAFVATSGHLDDALVTALTVLAALAVLRERPSWAGLLIGAAAAAKPWAVVVVPLLLGLRSRRLAALALAVVVPALAWAPFLVAEHRTVSALASFRLPVANASGLHLLGLAGQPCPDWVRPVQALVGLGLGLVAVRRGRWWAVPAVGLAVRVALDPGAIGYYAGSLAVVALLADGWARRVLPAATMVVFGALFYPAYLGLQAARHGAVLFTSPAAGLAVASVRLTACLVVIALALGVPSGRQSGDVVEAANLR